jgi:Flp pilus assembly protein TadD
MTRAILGRFGLAVLLALAVAFGAAAQSTGMVKGKVVDGKNQVVEGAKVVIEFKEGMNRKFEVKTNKKGEYLQIGLQPGMWLVTASKEGVGTASKEVRVSLGGSEQVDLALGAASPGGGMSKEEAEKAAAFQKVFDEGVAASQSGNVDVALARFTEALKAQPTCYPCQYNIGAAYLAKKDYAKAEAAFLEAAKLKPDAAEPYNQLANLYNQQKQFDKAGAMATEAAKRAPAGGAGGNPETSFNQGVVLWNAGKIAEAQVQFEAAAKAKPDYADAHYWIGMAHLNQGKLDQAAAAFQQYLKLAPTGQYAEQAKGVLSQIKK